MSDNTSPSTTPAATSASWRDWAYLYLAQLKEMAANAGAAIVAKVKKWSPIAQLSVTLVLVLSTAWLVGALHWPSHETFETPAAVDAKIEKLKQDLEDSTDRRVDQVTDVVSGLPTADAVRRMSVSKSEFVQLQASLNSLDARLKKLEAQVAALSASASRKRR